VSAVAETERNFCLADDLSRAANDANTVTIKAVVETANEEDMALRDESADPDSRVGSKSSSLASANNLLADDDTDDDGDDRMLFNADIVCSAHGEIQTEFFVVFMAHC